MRINIISYENPDLWILGKFAKNLHINLKNLGYDSIISDKPNTGYDINHHIIYNDFDENLINILK